MQVDEHAMLPVLLATAKAWHATRSQPDPAKPEQTHWLVIRIVRVAVAVKKFLVVQIWPGQLVRKTILYLGCRVDVLVKSCEFIV